MVVDNDERIVTRTIENDFSCKLIASAKNRRIKIESNENEEEIIYVHFKRPTEESFDSVRFEHLSCKIYK